MAAPFVPQDALQKEGRTLAEFDSHKPALQWLGVQA